MSKAFKKLIYIYVNFVCKLVNLFGYVLSVLICFQVFEGVFTLNHLFQIDPPTGHRIESVNLSGIAVPALSSTTLLKL